MNLIINMKLKISIVLFIYNNGPHNHAAFY
jgi:hypothetical protein